MAKIKLEYIWLDGSNPQQLRSKTKITESIDKTAIKNKLKAGGVVPGAEMEEGWNLGFR